MATGEHSPDARGSLNMLCDLAKDLARDAAKKATERQDDQVGCCGLLPAAHVDSSFAALQHAQSSCTCSAARHSAC